MKAPSISHRLVAVTAMAIVAILALVAVALGAGPVNGASYTGPLKVSKEETVSFTVSPSGKKVTNVRVTPYVPNKCGVGGTPPAESSKPATIRNGKFKAKLSEETSNGAVTGTATVTGRFLGHGKVKGLVENPLPQAKECAGNFAYTAIVADAPMARAAGGFRSCPDKTVKFTTVATETPEELTVRVKAIATHGTSCHAAYQFLHDLYNGEGFGKGNYPLGYTCKPVNSFTAPTGYLPTLCAKPGKKIRYGAKGG